MAYQQMLAIVLKKEALAANIYRMVILCKPLAQEAVPGQFLHILPKGSTLRRPISICEIDPSAGTLTIVFEVKGEGTRTIADLFPGNTIDAIPPCLHWHNIMENVRR